MRLFPVMATATMALLLIGPVSANAGRESARSHPPSIAS